MQGVESLTGREIAVIGMSGRFPGARNLGEFWRNLRDGLESVTFFSDEELLASGVEPELLHNPNYVKAGSLLDDVELFDASFFGYNAREAETLDPQQRLFLEDAWRALEDAGYSPQEYEGLIGVYAGVAWNTYLLSNLTTRPELFDGGGGFQVFIASDKDFMPTRVAYKFNLKGPGIVIQTSCSTSLVAVHLACLSLLNYECDIALVGGVTVKVPQKSGYFHQEGGLASPDGHCRPFDARAAGTIFGSGVGVVVLKRLSEAIEDRDHIRAVVKGSAINNDGSAKVSYTAPSVEGQAQVIAAAQAMAGVDLETIGYVETHGTGTSLGDPVEVTALTKAFRKSTTHTGFCAIGSVKSNIGHLDAAAGIAGFIKTVLAIENRELPPSINFDEPNPAIDFPETPFYVNSKLTRWENGNGPRRAAVSSFGVGGTNAHVILEEAPELEASGPSRPWQLLLLSAKTQNALEAATVQFGAWLRQNEGLSFPDVAYTLKTGRSVFRHRRMLVCRDRLDALAALEGPAGSRLLSAVDTDEPRGRPVVFMFPGQGSQYVGMTRELYEQEPAFRDRIDECARFLEPHLGFRLQTALYPESGMAAGAAARIEQTSLAQPLLFVIQYALSDLWMSWGVKPAAMIGHSIGEYVAACIAGVFSLEDALMLVAARGRLMQEQPAGVMLAVSLSDQEVQPLLTEGVSLAAVNEPSSCVVSGSHEAVGKLESEFATRGLEYRRLHTSHAFHSSMMEPVLSAFTEKVGQVRMQPPRVPFISNLTGAWITPDQATDPGYWARHLRETVRFSRGIEELLTDVDRVFLEMGPGRVLSTLVSRHPEGRGRVVISSVRHPREEISDGALILEGLGRLWLAGVKIDWAGFYKDERRHRVPLPTYPFESRRYWIEPRPRRRGFDSDDAGAQATKRSNISEWFYLPSWKPSPLLSTSTEAAGRVLVMLDGVGFGASLATRLSGQGRDVVTVEAGDRFDRTNAAGYTMRPGSSDDYAALFEDLKNGAGLPDAIVHAFSLTPSVEATDSSTFDAVQETGFYSLLRLLQVLERYPDQKFDVTVLSNGVLSITSDEAVVPEKATMIGLCRVAEQELINVAARFVDLGESPDHASSSPSLTDSLVRELDCRSNEMIVAYRGRQRWVESFEPIKPEAAAEPGALREHGVYLITGGLSGNGLALAKYLAREFKARLLLIEDMPNDGARPDGSDERSRLIETLKSLGAEVCVLHSDLTDRAALHRAWDQGKQQFGAIHGVIHAEEPMGERAFRALAEASREECEWHFRPKARALYALEGVIKNERIDFCVLVSSLAAALGGIGFGPYAAANLFMDSFVKRSNRTNLVPWLSVNWDLWSSEEIRDEITGLRSDLSDLGMNVREGEEAFRLALSARGVDQLFVSTASLPARVAWMRQRFSGLRSRREAGAAEGAEAALHPRPPLPNPYVAPEGDLEGRIAAVWQQVLGFEQIGADDNFFDLGGDSLIAIRVVTRLKQELEIDFPVAKLYQGVTVRTLAQLLVQDEEGERRLRAEQLAEHKQTANRRQEYIKRRRARK